MWREEWEVAVWSWCSGGEEMKVEGSGVRGVKVVAVGCGGKSGRLLCGCGAVEEWGDCGVMGKGRWEVAVSWVLWRRREESGGKLHDVGDEEKREKRKKKEKGGKERKKKRKKKKIKRKRKGRKG